MDKLSKEEQEKEKKRKKARISKEEKKLRKSYESIPDELMNIAEGLIRRAAYMKITLEDYENDLDDGGYVEQFSQSEKQEPYDRERPVARLYNAMNKNYQSIIKQLADMVVKRQPNGGEQDDGFDNFVSQK